jgi:hypothetical protein
MIVAFLQIYTTFTKCSGIIFRINIYTMNIGKSTNTFCIFVILASLVFSLGSCNRKVYPSGLEGNLLGTQKNFKREVRQRERMARKAERRTARLERKALRPQAKEKRRAEKGSKQAVENHIKKQHPDVQARMKENQRYTKQRYASRKTFWERVQFWKKNK